MSRFTRPPQAPAYIAGRAGNSQVRERERRPYYQHTQRGIG
jgi:hypothetical protein